jgi:ribosomal protein S18 acetylase RimI-like enzyme
MNILFTSEFDPRRLDETIGFLSGPRLFAKNSDYPDFLSWLQKVESELCSGKKHSILAVEKNQIIGVVVYQKHKLLRGTLEIKNLTVRPDKAGRHIGSFLMKNAEREGGIHFKADTVVCDTKRNNLAVRTFLFSQKYLLLGHQDLYGKKGGDDFVYLKKITATNFR